MKRNILRAIASIYGPLGLLQPIVSSIEILAERTHRDNMLWDNEIERELPGYTGFIF